MTRSVRTPGGLKALETHEGFGAMLAARVGGALTRRVMIAMSRDRTSRGQVPRRRGEGGFLGGKTPGGQNPKGVSGVKQTRKTQGGVNRRGGEKPRGRNVPGEASPGLVDSLR
jgi:hypothetical protein